VIEEALQVQRWRLRMLDDGRGTDEAPPVVH
jgi:hypothetical protein